MRSSSLQKLSLLLMLCLLAFRPSTISYAQQSQRPFAVDDLFEIEGVGHQFGGPYAFSSDGKQLAYTRVRGKKSLANHKWEWLLDNAGGDVWVKLDPKGSPTNITNGAIDGSGWWAPQWSPDGQKLAMLSTRGDNVYVWVWDARDKSLKQISQHGVDLDGDMRDRPFLWLDSDHILCGVLQGAEKTLSMVIELQSSTIAESEWPKVAKGLETTSSAIDSGVPPKTSERLQSELESINVRTGSVRVLTHSRTRFWQLSPDGTVIAYVKQVSQYIPRPNEPLPLIFSSVDTVQFVTTAGRALTFDGNISQDIFRDSMRWSPDGDELAFVGYSSSRDTPPSIYRANMTTRTISAQRMREDLDMRPGLRGAVQLEWTSTKDLIVRATKRIDSTRPKDSARRDWWLVRQDGELQLLTGGMPDVPREVWAQEGRLGFIGLAGGDLWRLDVVRRTTEDLTSVLREKVTQVCWPSTNPSGTAQYRILGKTYAEMLFSATTSRGSSTFMLETASGKISAVDKPSDKATLVAYEPKTATGIFFEDDRSGLQIWSKSVHKPAATQLASANSFLRNVAEASFKRIQYTGSNGEKLQGWVLLPNGYESSKRYPLIVWVYPGAVYVERPSPALAGIDSSFALNLQIPAAKGYAILFPSMPSSPEGSVGDPMLRLTESVMPAVEEAIEVGVADPDRLFLLGQSFGGFATYGLVTQTQRFKAAVSLAGPSDLISLYGTFDARYRYTEYPQDNLSQQAILEVGQIGMGGPPWTESNRYMRNSPISYADRILTPLMIIQGDMDLVPMQQGEEMFTALYRQGKRARFVRYWGEGHVLQSPANIRDMWKNIFSWFDSFSLENKLADPPN